MVVLVVRLMVWLSTMLSLLMVMAVMLQVRVAGSRLLGLGRRTHNVVAARHTDVWRQRWCW